MATGFYMFTCYFSPRTIATVTPLEPIFESPFGTAYTCCTQSLWVLHISFNMFRIVVQCRNKRLSLVVRDTLLMLFIKSLK